MSSHHLLARFRCQAELERITHHIAHVLHHDPTATSPLRGQASPGELRGIPVVGAPGVGGAIPHTRPEHEACR